MAGSLEVPFNRPSLLNTELDTLSEAISLESFRLICISDRRFRPPGIKIRGGHMKKPR